MLWLCGRLRGRPTLLIVVVAIAILLLTRTRTALIGMTAGILVAGLSLIIVKARVRRLFAIAGAIAATRHHDAVQRDHRVPGSRRGHATSWST